MEHTKEPWEWSEHKFNAPPFEGTLDHECGIYPPDGESGPVAIASGKNDARRIVACVNACAGVTTEELEQGGFVAGLVERLEDAPRWRDVVDELPQEAQEVLFVRGGKTVHGAWIGGIFWHSNQQMAAATWMPLPKPPAESKLATAVKMARGGERGKRAGDDRKGTLPAVQTEAAGRVMKTHNAEVTGA